jgi:hypothetical protein
MFGEKETFEGTKEEVLEMAAIEWSRTEREL